MPTCRAVHACARALALAATYLLRAVALIQEVDALAPRVDDARQLERTWPLLPPGRPRVSGSPYLCLRRVAAQMDGLGWRGRWRWRRGMRGPHSPALVASIGRARWCTSRGERRGRLGKREERGRSGGGGGGSGQRAAGRARRQRGQHSGARVEEARLGCVTGALRGDDGARVPGPSRCALRSGRGHRELLMLAWPQARPVCLGRCPGLPAQDDCYEILVIRPDLVRCDPLWLIFEGDASPHPSLRPLRDSACRHSLP